MSKRKKCSYSPFPNAHGITETLKNSADYYNQYTYNYYINYLKDLALARFIWNLPDTIDVRFFEMCLQEYGSVCVFMEDVAGKLTALPFDASGKYDIQGNPNNIVAFSPYTEYRVELEKGDYVVCWNNFMRRPDFPALRLYADKLTDIERTIDVNIENQKTPKFIIANEGQKMTAQNIDMQRTMNVPVIYLKESYVADSTNIPVIDMTVPYMCDKLDVHKHVIWNEVLTFLAIENSNQDKKERMIQGEVNGNYGNVEMCRNSSMESRRIFLRDLEKTFGYKGDVEFNSNISHMNVMDDSVMNIPEDNVSRETLKGVES